MDLCKLNYLQHVSCVVLGTKVDGELKCMKTNHICERHLGEKVKLVPFFG
jgi:hypothetical protein